MEATEILDEIRKNAIYRIDENSRMIGIALNGLSEEDIWSRPNKVSNSIGNQILHLCGNMMQYAISALGENEDIRVRDLEFSTKEGFAKIDLLSKLMVVTAQVKENIALSSQDNLLKKREVQGFSFTGIGIIIHVVEHYSYHTGQIAFWVKQLKNKEMGFYDGVDLNKKNK